MTETKLKRFYSVMNEAVRLSEIDNGDKTTWNYNSYTPEVFFEKYLAKYIKTVKKEEKNGEYYVYFADGSLVQISSNGKDYYFYVNNLKNYSPTVRGKDMFAFLFYPASIDVGMKFARGKGIEPYTYNWDGSDEALYEHSRYGCANGIYPNFCTKIIQMNGWKIPENYPLKF